MCDLTTIYIVRHAEAEGNVWRRVHGHFDSLLTPNGIRQVELLSQRFCSIQYDAVFSSDLYRARRTAMAAAGPFKSSLYTDPRLREVCFGDWEDEPFAEAAHRDSYMWSKLEHDIWSFHVNNSETQTDVLSRFLEVFEEIIRVWHGSTVVVFSHGLALQIFFAHIMNITSSEDGRTPHFDNTAVSKLIHDGSKFNIEFMNDVSHLPDDLRTLINRRSQEAKFGRSIELRFERHDANNAGIITAILGTEEVGTLELVLTDNCDSAGIINSMELKPEYRNFGLGIQLIGEAAHVFRKIGRIGLRVHDVGRAGNFFRNNGFIETAHNSFERNLTVAAANHELF